MAETEETNRGTTKDRGTAKNKRCDQEEPPSLELNFKVALGALSGLVTLLKQDARVEVVGMAHIIHEFVGTLLRVYSHTLKISKEEITYRMIAYCQDESNGIDLAVNLHKNEQQTLS